MDGRPVDFDSGLVGDEEDVIEGVGDTEPERQASKKAEDGVGIGG